MNIPDLQGANVHYSHLQHRPVRDLAWALLQAPLFRAVPQLPESWLQTSWLDNNLPAWLNHLDNQPEALLAHLKDQRATRLGIYFEQLLSFYFSYYPRFELIAKNLQVNDAKRTLGEYDFIVLDHNDKQYYHYEVAVKFYLGYPTEQQALANSIAKNRALHNWHLWIGPNKKDSLAIKMNHLREHQLPLAHTNAGKAALRSIGLEDSTIHSKLLLTGCLYQPLSGTIAPPRYSHQNQANYQWLPHSQLNHADAFSNKMDYIILPRQLWLADIQVNDINTYALKLLNSKNIKAAITEHFTQDAQPLHIAELQSQNSVIDAQTRRLFVILGDNPQ